MKFRSQSAGRVSEVEGIVILEQFTPLLEICLHISRRHGLGHGRLLCVVRGGELVIHFLPILERPYVLLSTSELLSHVYDTLTKEIEMFCRLLPSSRGSSLCSLLYIGSKKQGAAIAVLLVWNYPLSPAMLGFALQNSISREPLDIWICHFHTGFRTPRCFDTPDFQINSKQFNTPRWGIFES
jgi:hypothetical protein